MNIYVLIPVFNRLCCTKTIIKCLRRQTYKKYLKVYVVNDGSTDGTENWLNEQPDIVTLKGDGSLFWSGAINLGLKNIVKKLKCKAGGSVSSTSEKTEDDGGWKLWKKPEWMKKKN